MGRCKICGKPTYGNFPYCRECYEKQKGAKEEKTPEPEQKAKPEKGVCQICGKPSGRYPLCYEHSRMIQTGDVVKNEQGVWVLASKEKKEEIAKANMADTKEAFANDYESEEYKNVAGREIRLGDESEDDDGKVKCLICGKPTTHGHHFCHDCYVKFSKKELFLQISGCTKAIVLSADYQSPVKCRDGHKVKSKIEREIDDYLDMNGKKHIYEEKMTLIKSDGTSIVYHPDFCLPDYFPDEKGYKKNLYIEHLGRWGLDPFYDKVALQKEKDYESAGLTVIFTYENELGNESVDGFFNPIFNNELFKPGTIIGRPSERKTGE